MPLPPPRSDVESAVEWLRKKGLSGADKKAGRVAAEGVVAAYIHPGSRLGVLLEVNCETDFVARSDPFNKLVNGLAMQIAASPQVRFSCTTGWWDDLAVQVAAPFQPPRPLAPIQQLSMQAFRLNCWGLVHYNACCGYDNGSDHASLLHVPQPHTQHPTPPVPHTATPPLAGAVRGR